MKYLLYLSTMLIVFPFGCMRKEKTEIDQKSPHMVVILQGIIKDGGNSMVMLEEMGAREFIPIDTVETNQEGEFRFDFNSESVAFYVLRYGEGGYVTLLMEPGERAVFTGAVNEKEDYQVSGSAGSELLQKLAVEHKRTLHELSAITRSIMNLSGSPEYVTLKSDLDRQFDSITTAFQSYSREFIYENSNSLAILVALYNLYGQGLPVFSPGEDLDVYKYVDSVLTEKYKGFEAVDLLHAQIAEAENMQSDIPLQESLELGVKAPDFVSSRPDGSQMALSDLRGNYVLISFWAGWSKTSRDENPTLKRAFERFGNDKFRILQVSFDEDRQVWLDAIDQDQLEWIHVSDLRRWETPVADLYRVEKIPSNNLIDPEGRIVGSNLFGDKLINRLETLLTHE
jgi:peroxiredoxin